MHNLKMSCFFLKEHIGKSFFYYAKQSCVKLTDKDTDFSRKMCEDSFLMYLSEFITATAGCHESHGLDYIKEIRRTGYRVL